MSLLSKLREKQAGKIATATPATFATQGGERGRAVATVAVATLRIPMSARQLSASMSIKEETAITAWLTWIKENDPATAAEVIERCRRDTDAREYFTGRAAAELPKPDPFTDDRRTCQQCANLIARRCQAAKRGEIAASRAYEPIRDLPRRCEGYAPGADDPDRRHGRERWPELGAKTN